jgi:hypothetical protein
VWARANYSSKGTQVTNVESKDDGKGFFSNLWNNLFGKATPHNCYGTSGSVSGCDKQWQEVTIPKSNSPAITKPDYKAPVIVPQYQCHVQVSATRLALNFNPCFFKDQPLGAGL